MIGAYEQILVDKYEQYLEVTYTLPSGSRSDRSTGLTPKRGPAGMISSAILAR